MFLRPLKGTRTLAELMLAEMPDGTFWGKNLMNFTGQFPVEQDGDVLIYPGNLQPLFKKRYSVAAQ